MRVAIPPVGPAFFVPNAAQSLTEAHTVLIANDRVR